MKAGIPTWATALTIDSSPVEPVFLFRQQSLTSKQNRPLEVNLLLVQQENEKPLCLISIDTLFVGRLFRTQLLKKLGDNWSYGEERILLISSHSHNAPILDDSKPHLGRLQPEYLDLVSDRLCQGIIKAQKELQPVKLQYGSSIAELSVNRRKWSWGRAGIFPVRKIKTLPNPNGPVDKRIRLWRLLTESNHTLGIIWNYSCHPVSWPDPKEISADYMGLVRDQLRAELKNVPVLFMPGFMGDVRPPFYGVPENWRDMLMWTLFSKVFIRPTMSRFETWSHKLGSCAIQALTSARDLEWTRICIKAEFLSLKVFLVDPLPGFLEIGVVHGFGNQVWCYASAEVLTEYLPLLPPILSTKLEDVIPIGYVNHVFGYLPLDRHIKAGGYETEEFMPWFSLGANEFFSHIEHYVLDSWAQLHKDLLPKPPTSASNNPFLLVE
jgi:hypothetical protein